MPGGAFHPQAFDASAFSPQAFSSQESAPGALRGSFSSAFASAPADLVLLVRQQASPFAAYDRYRVRPGSIYIGSAADCGLQFTFSSGGQQYITQYHAELRFDGTSFGIYDRSRCCSSS